MWFEHYSADLAVVRHLLVKEPRELEVLNRNPHVFSAEVKQGY